MVQKFLKNLSIAEDDDTDSDSDSDTENEPADPAENDFDSVSSLRSIINKIRAIAKSIRSSTHKWERFQNACQSYQLKAMTIPLDITIRWNSTFRMLHQAVYLRRPIHRYVDDLDATQLQISPEEWREAELLLLFLLPFQRCTKRFECNSGQTEIDYVFFAYDTMFNHIDDIKEKLGTKTGIGALPCATYMLNAINKMEAVLKGYYSKTALPTVYGDGMILNPRVKLVLLQGETWDEGDAEEYSESCRRRFVSEYQGSASAAVARSYPQVVITKRPVSRAFSGDPEYEAILASRSAKRRINDFDRYIEVPNDPDIPSGLGWWKENHKLYPDLSLMTRDNLAVPASGCAVERQFSISGRIAIWQRNRLSPRVISDALIYKGWLAKTRAPLRVQSETVDDIDILPVDEEPGQVPEEWTQNWWLDNLGKSSVNKDIIRLYEARLDEEEEEEEDLYG